MAGQFHARPQSMKISEIRPQNNEALYTCSFCILSRAAGGLDIVAVKEWVGWGFWRHPVIHPGGEDHSVMPSQERKQLAIRESIEITQLDFHNIRK
jgi:hypothetical protein